MVNVAVVIPYYQTAPGILSAALQSVFAQELPPETDLTLYIVDDESPLALSTEIVDIEVPIWINIKTFLRPNGGPGAARNTALDALKDTETDFVAFLDSDDRWSRTHIRDGLAALTDRTSFYFCDHTRDGFSGSLFTSELSTVTNWQHSTKPVLIPIPHAPETFAVSGALVFERMLVEYLSQTSTVIFNFRIHSAARFNESLRNAGEDGFLWLQLAATSTCVAVSLNKNVHCGTGVSIYYGSFDWNSNKAVARYGYLILYRLHIIRSFTLTAIDSAVVHQQLESTTNAYAYLLIRQLARRTAPDFKLIAALARQDPIRMALMPLHFWRGLRNRKQAAELW